MSERENVILQILASGVVNASQVEIDPYFMEPRFNLAGKAAKHAMQISERETGRTFYRLGNEFVSHEVLILVSERHPLEDVRTKAIEILNNIGTGY